MPVQFRRPQAARARHGAASPNRPYAHPFYPFDPSSPSILSVAHDTADGAALFVITDRPVSLAGGAAFDLPLSIDAAGGYPLRVLSAAATSVPVKFRLQLSGPVPAGAAWAWGPFVPGGADLVDPVTNHPLNAGSGDCADVPGPYVPPPPANVVSTSYGSTGSEGWANLTFDRPVILNNLSVDDAVIFAGFYAATRVEQVSADTLSFYLSMPVSSGQSWAVTRQPAWVQSPVAWPQGGTF